MTTSPAPLQPIESPAIPLDRKSGFVVSFTFNGQPYTVTADCECQATDCTLQACPAAHDRAGELTVILTCAQHGARIILALVENNRQRSSRERAVFAWAAQRFYRDKRPGW